MRYIGNKTRLLDFISGVVATLELRSGVVLDAFAGTSSVGRALKRQGFTVHGCDVLHFSYILQRAYLELDTLPDFSALLAALSGCARKGGLHHAAVEQPLLSDNTIAAQNELQRVLSFLNERLPPRPSVVTREFSGSGDTNADSGDGHSHAGRRYFTAANASRIDAVRETLSEWNQGALIGRDAYHLLLTALLEALDAVANTTGVYAAFVKSWQPNALRDLTLQVPEITVNTGLRCRAHEGDVNSLVRELRGLDLVYLDPPYNSRQYSSYYHIPELVALGWHAGVPELRGKSGLIPDNGKRSDWSLRTRCVGALNDLIEHVDARYVLMSYNSEGIIPEDEIRRAFVGRGVPGTYHVHERNYARYRSDRDGSNRRYSSSTVTEKLYFVELRAR